jgi:arabinan endo-1,5-alpha-L-arabinosidase
MKQNAGLSLIALLLALLATVVPRHSFAEEKVAKAKIEVGQYTHIYDPSIGENVPWYINDHCFIEGDDGTWHLFGITRAEPAKPMEEIHFAHATARKLLQQPWDKRPFALSVAREKPWQERHLWAPHVIKHDGLFYMYYCAGGDSNLTYRIHLATSPDLEKWTRSPKNPMLIDGFDARDPCVFRYGEKWIMYYTATRPVQEGNHVVVAVTSDDLLHWRDPKVVFTHPEVGKWGGPTESPFVFTRGGKFYLAACDMPPYDKTTFYQSDSPYYWNIANSVGTTPAHCAEVIRTREGKWYVSRAGWGRKGVYIAELKWLE